MQSQSGSNLKTQNGTSITNQKESRTGLHFYSNASNISTSLYDSKSIKDIGYFKNILDCSRNLFTLYNKGNYLSLVNKKLKEIKNTSLDILASDYLVTLHQKQTKKFDDADNSNINSLNNQTERISLVQNKSTLDSLDQSKTTTLLLNNYYNRLNVMHQNKTVCFSNKQESNDNGINCHIDKQNKQLNSLIKSNTLNKGTKIFSVRLAKLSPSDVNTKTSTQNSFLHNSNPSILKRKKEKSNALLPSVTVTVTDNHQFKLPSRLKYYHMPYSQKKQRGTLKNEVNRLLLKRTSNNLISADNDKLLMTDHNKEIITKILFIQKFLDKLPSNQFYSDRPRHRKIFVIQDGTVAFNYRFITGNFIEIPSLRYLSYLNSKKERMKLYNRFIAACMIEFKLSIPIKAAFLINGTFIDDLSLIPESEKALYITTGVIFQGLHIMSNISNDIKKLTTETDLKLLDNKTVRLPYGKKPFGAGLMFKKKKMNKQSKQYRIIHKKCDHLLEQSFTFGLTSASDTEEYLYYSDNESKKQSTRKVIKSLYSNHIDHILALSKDQMNTKITEVSKQSQSKMSKHNRHQPNEKTIEGIVSLINTYNNIRSKKYKINVSHQLNNDRLMQKQLDEKTKEMMMLFLKKLKIFQNYKDNSAVFDSKAFYGIQSVKPDKIYQNIKMTSNILKDSTRKIQKYYPDLISFNIPQILKSFPKLKRREFYDVFIQFKTLLNLCVNVSKNIKVIDKGIDFDTFFNCNPQMKFQGLELAKKIYREMNTLNEKYLNWEHYMFGMLTMKYKDIVKKIDLFLGIIDSDKNGALSYAEVLDLSISSLGRAFSLVSPKGKKDDDNKKEDSQDQIIFVLAEFFAQFIFSLVNRPITDEIPINDIKEKIIEGGNATSYLEMFICADNFT